MSHHTPRVLNKRTDTAPIGAVYIGRPSKWGNPFTHLSGKTRAQFQVPTLQEAVAAYRAWVLEQPQLVAALPELRGRDLVCWCNPGPCHGDVLLELANHPEAS
jgi:Domain of unknown function (DUF4326)